MSDAEPEHELAERSRFASLNCLKKVINALFSPALQSFKLVAVAFQVVNVGDTFQHTNRDQPVHYRFTHSLDVHGTPRSEVLNATADLSGTLIVFAVVRRFAFKPDNRLAARRTLLRELEWLRPRRTLLFEETNNCRDDVSALLNYHSVADANIFLFYVIFIMERRAAYR